MVEDMTIREFAPKTQHDYLQRVENFTIHLGRSPDTASSEDVRRYETSPDGERRWRPHRQPDGSRRCGYSSRSRSGGPTSLSARHSSMNRAGHDAAADRDRGRHLDRCRQPKKASARDAFPPAHRRAPPSAPSTIPARIASRNCRCGAWQRVRRSVAFKRPEITR